MPLRALRTIVLAATSAALSATAVLPETAAAAVVFSDWTSVNTTPGNHRLTIEDTGTQFAWTLTISPWNAEALGLFVDLGAVNMPATVSITNLIQSASVTLAGKDTSSSSCGSGCNLNGLALPTLAGGDWELVFRLGSTGFDGIQTYSWTTSDFGLGESDIRLAAVRAQQLCGVGQTLNNGAGECNGSDKAWAWPASNPGPELTPPPSLFSPPPSGVPLPATLSLMLAAAGAALVVRRRRYSSMR